MLTEKQIAAKKEEKKLKVYTASFWVVIALCVCLVAGMALRNPVIGVTRNVTNAVVVGDHQLDAVELNYFYIDSINNYLNNYGSYLQYFMEDPSKPIGEQYYDAESKTTWADEFLRMALDSAKSNYAMYDAAVKAGYTLPEDEQKELDSLAADLKAAAKSYGYATAGGYLKAMYGAGASLSSYKAYCKITTLASSYYNAYTADLKASYTDSDLREYEADKKYEYNSYTYDSHYMNVESYKEGGTKDDSGNVTYSAEEIAAAEAALKKDAESLAIAENNTAEALNAAIKALEQSKQSATATSDEATKYSTCTNNDDVLYSSINSAVQEWIRDEARKDGDIAALPYTTSSTDADGKTVDTLKGYYVVIYHSSNDNAYALKDVRHILVSYEGGTTNDSGTTTYSDAEKAAAKEKAEAILKEWTEGKATEESFGELAHEKSTDTGSKENGGLYEAVYPGQMVAPFENWCYEEGRKAGDTGIVQTDYGYHVMYFSGDNEVNYRDYMVTNDLLSADIEKWQTALNDAMKVTENNTKHINRDLVLGQSSSTTTDDHEGHDHD